MLTAYWHVSPQWGPVNKKLSEEAFMINRERAVDYLNTRTRLYVFDGFAGWDPKYRIKVRIVCARAYHGILLYWHDGPVTKIKLALFMRNMLIRPTDEELENYGHPDFTIFNAGQFPCNRYTTGMTSTTSVAINFKKNEMGKVMLVSCFYLYSWLFSYIGNPVRWWNEEGNIYSHALSDAKVRSTFASLERKRGMIVFHDARKSVILKF
jgi:hypothetical protein